MRGSLLKSLLELAHATSQNLGFAHQVGVHVSYGEETITETNLLELCRRHPSIIHLRTFSKKKESLNGADWEWHIIGRTRKLKMRVRSIERQGGGEISASGPVRKPASFALAYFFLRALEFQAFSVCFLVAVRRRFNDTRVFL